MKGSLKAILILLAILINATCDQTDFRNNLLTVQPQESSRLLASYQLPYPIYLSYINGVKAWWGDPFLAGLGVPGYASKNPYNYFCLSFWLSSGPVDMALVWANAAQYLSFLGSSTNQIQLKLKKAYNQAGKKIMVSAFGATQFPTSEGKDPIQTANSLADFVLGNNLDGVDIDWQDNGAMEAGKGQAWLISFQRQLRIRLPNHIISHAPQAPYFKQQYYKNGAYIAVNKAVGSTIDFYNIQFYNQGDTSYDSYQRLFTSSGGYFSGSSVQQIINRGVPYKKVIIGKPSQPQDAMNTGYVQASNLGQWLNKFKQQTGNQMSLMFWQFINDNDGKIISNVLQSAGRSTRQQAIKGVYGEDVVQDVDQVEDQNQVSNVQSKVTYPIYFAYVNSINSWWGDSMLAGLGVPGYAKGTPYNYIALAFWLSTGPVDTALLWANAAYYMSFLGNNTQDIQKKIKKMYNDKGIKIMVSAFGATQFPTSDGKDPIETANKLADFVLANNFDGVDIDWEDNAAMQAGKGEAWLISFQKVLRARLPYSIICHAPQAPYFKEQFYKNGAYITVNKAVGTTIDFYTVQFYNQGNTQYNTYQTLFLKSTGYFNGTSVKQIQARGVPLKKIVIGKPVTPADVMNSGYVKATDLGTFYAKFKKTYNWTPNLMIWQLSSDPNYTFCKTVLAKAGVSYKIASTGISAPWAQSIEDQPLLEDTPLVDALYPVTGASHVLSMFYCGFSGNFCGQSTTNDVNAKSAIIILAFANTQNDGSIIIDDANFPTTLVKAWRAKTKKIIISVGGQNGDWNVVFQSEESVNNFVNSVANYLRKYNLDGVDLDIQGYHTPPRKVANMIIALKKKIGSKLLIVSPQCVTVYQGTSVPSADTGGQAFNYFVPIIQLADSSIDFYQIQAYNNWYGGQTGGSLGYLQQVYLQWRNLKGTDVWANPISGFKGVTGDKLMMGLIASTQAGGSAYYAPPSVIRSFKQWISKNKYPLKGFMMWDSNWDKLNGYAISDACVDKVI